MGDPTLKVKPADPDFLVRDPVTGRILPQGEYSEVENNSYWRRRLRDGSVLKEGQTPPASTGGNGNGSADSGDGGDPHALAKKAKK